MKIRLIIADPAGNITAIVKNTEIKKKQYAEIANAIMKQEGFRIEQVGFEKPPVFGGEARLEMMGGEFCGNASRSFGKYVAQRKNGKEAMIEITGNGQLMRITCNEETGTAKAQMPCPKRVEEIEYDHQTFPVVLFEGIHHVIIENREMNEALTKGLQKFVAQKFHSEAVGIMYLNSEKKSLIPVVWVREVGSLVYENSCGSGSVAVAAYLSWNKEDGKYNYCLKQPGGMIEAEVILEGKRIVLASINGPVTLSEEITMEIETDVML